MRALALGSCLAFTLLGSAASAQLPCDFQINQAQSGFVWDATVSIGNFVEDPSTFQLQGTVAMNLATAGNPASTGEFTGGNALVVPDLHGFVPNIFPFLPPLAEVDVTNLSLSPTSPIFHGSTVTPGSFTADVTVTILSGTAAIVSPFGNDVLDLTGSTSTPALYTGTLVKSGSNLTLTLPVSLNVPFADPGSGISGTFTMNGTVSGTADLTSGCGATFFEEPEAISLSAGGVHSLHLDADATNASQLYWIFGSATGTSPGLPPLPLNFDAYFLFTLQHPNTLIASSLSFLDGQGKGLGSITLPAGLDPGLAGVTLNHAYAVVDVTTFATLLVSNPTALSLVP